MNSVNPANIASRFGAPMLCTLLLLAFAACGSAAMAAERPVALALIVSGATQPVVEEYDELLSGQLIGLSEETNFQFLHYRSCTTVTVKGGQISFGQIDYKID